MLENDDQLVSYGLDSSVNVNRSFPTNAQQTLITDVSVQKSQVNQKTTFQCSISYLQTHVIHYTIKNNSKKPIEKLYLDHSAKSTHGGFVITTKENCVKSVTGWSRFEFKLEPQQELKFVVEEQATYSENLSTGRLVSFINHQSVGLMDQKILSKQNFHGILEIIRNLDRETVHRDILADRYDNFRTWRQGLSAKISVDMGDFDDSVISSELLGKVGEMINLKGQIEAFRSQIRTHEDRINKVFTNQSRLRENIRSLENVHNSDLVQRYLLDLNREEDDLIRTRQTISTLEDQISNLRTKLQELKLTTCEDVNKLMR